MSDPQPQSQHAYVTPSPSAGAPPSATANKFGTAPVGAFVATAVVAVGGAVAYVLASNHRVRAMCGSEQMGPGDLCDTTNRSGVVTDTQTYTEVLATALRVNQVIQWVGLALVVIGVVFAVLTVIRWRQDRQTLAQLGTEHGEPLSAHSRTASSGLLLLIFGAGLLGLALYFLLTGLGRGDWPWFIGTAIAGALAAGLLWAAIPGNGQLVQVFGAGVRVVSHGRVTDVAWRDLDYQIVPVKNAVNHTILGGGLKSAISLNQLTDSQRLQGAVAARTVQSKLQPAIEAVNRGETVSFGRLGVSREGISHGRKQLPWQAFGGLALHQGQVSIAQQPKGSFATVGLGLVTNYALLVHLVEAVRSQQPRHG